MSFVLEHMNSNLWRGRFTHFPSDVLEHGISARLGGVSVAPYSALNMGLHVGDEPERSSRTAGVSSMLWSSRQKMPAALSRCMAPKSCA